MHEARIAALQGMPIFGGLRSDVLASLLEVSSTVEVPKDAFFFREGDKAEAVFVLEAGEVAILKQWGGQQFLLGRLLDLFPRSASVRADDGCTALALSTASFHKLYETDVEQFAIVQMNIARELSRRLREADERLFRAHVGALRPEPDYSLLII
jgi:CRP-like cAMP-binding protein